MPYSSKVFDNILVDHVDRLRPESVLDVGAGSGKNCSLIRNNCSWKPKEIHAIEPTDYYIEKFGLKSHYDNVYNVDVRKWLSENYRCYDVVMAGDVFEHLFKSEVFDVVDAILYRTKWLIIVWPTNMPQHSHVDISVGEKINNLYETHKSNFNLSDFSRSYNVHYYVKQHGHYLFNDPKSAKVDFHYIVLSGVRLNSDESIYNFQLW